MISIQVFLLHFQVIFINHCSNIDRLLIEILCMTENEGFDMLRMCHVRILLSVGILWTILVYLIEFLEFTDSLVHLTWKRG